MKNFYFLVVTFLLMFPAEVMAGPGGSIVKAATKTIWGKIILGLLFVILLPFIIYISIKEYLAKRKAMKTLRVAGLSLPDFDWIKLKRRVEDCYTRVHDAWDKNDTHLAADWMTNWYWQNQQLVHLDRWESEGLKNICEVYKIKSVTPIMFAYRNDGGTPGEGSELAVVITAKMVDYLMRKSDSRIVEGDAKAKDANHIWSFTYEKGKWLVSSIAPYEQLSDYLEIMSAQPSPDELKAYLATN
ncbi:Tim44-like domain [Rubritalea squalenifaciens DSM 18772]|uniref:Tim44-like domain n=1 Tax=Rubritalea squalenifaciens DSM 18772 TaxID=1123071 RepID=A0A1M6QLQ2_9BACT|nr:TIM44-like domain-containing protein [Rubritalea squalenifaciens]SHK21108.1 Tim44-like domain [Rubritalea squalenifaciens DSM 18772]